MTPYRDWDQDSGISTYELDLSYVNVGFKDGVIYRYASLSVGQANRDPVIVLVRTGDGLDLVVFGEEGGQFDAAGYRAC